MIDFHVISTGSKGNAVIVNKDILVDCGVPFRALGGAYEGLRLVLLTHGHGDHFSRSTVRRLARERPSLRFGCCEWLVGSLVDCGVEKKNIDIYAASMDHKYYQYPGFAVWAFPLIHDVPNCGYGIGISTGGYALYATDTNSLDGIEAKNYDLYLIEANYSEEEITERIRAKQASGRYCHEWDVLKNHMSKNKADDWLYQNMGPNSRYVYLHGHETA
jgi:ribonuclease BN (tRNA processing enzyme)